MLRKPKQSPPLPVSSSALYLRALPWLPGVLQGVADVGPTADGALQHDGASHGGRGVDPPGPTATRVDIGLGFLLLVVTVAVMARQHLPLPDLTVKTSRWVFAIVVCYVE